MSAYEIITDNIIASLEKGTIPWQQPFKYGRPLRHNGVPYRGFNKFFLNHCAISEEYTSPYWMTLHQGKEYGGTLRAGSKGSLVTFYKKFTIKGDDTTTDEAEETEVIAPTPQGRSFPLLRYSYAFNASQFIDLPEKFFPAVSGGMEMLAHAEADAIIKGYPSPPRIIEAMTMPCYSPSSDTVSTPAMNMARSAEAYYATMFHELIHSTGHSSRLNRSLSNPFGTPEYAYEELIAEIGACFLVGEAGLSGIDYENSAAYIASWIKALQNDKKLIVKASGKAEIAANHILNRADADQKAA